MRRAVGAKGTGWFITTDPWEIHIITYIKCSMRLKEEKEEEEEG